MEPLLDPVPLLEPVSEDPVLLLGLLEPVLLLLPEPMSLELLLGLVDEVPLWSLVEPFFL